MEREVTQDVMRAGAITLRHLRANPDGATFKEIQRAVGKAKCKNSNPHMRRAFNWLRNDCDAPVDFSRKTARWTLTDLDFTLPLLDPTPDDLMAVLFASAVLDPLVNEEMSAHLRRMVENIDAVIRDQSTGGKGEKIVLRANALTATFTAGGRVDAQLLFKLLRAVSEARVLRVQYQSPWRDDSKAYDVEPWQLRVHDGALYLRAFSRSVGEARNFRVAGIEHARVLSGQKPKERRPPPAQVWADDPAFGIDEDRPGIATVRVKGPFARWVALDRWHSEQDDKWVDDGKFLQRSLPYRSCREMARKLLMLGDALVGVEPKELRDEVVGHATALQTL
jgi:predicted DNA-binding transcriptional regulator YafY